MPDSTPPKDDPTAVKPSHLIATGALVPALSTVMIWGSTWPIKALDMATANALASLVVGVVGAIVYWWQSRKEAAPKADPSWPPKPIYPIPARPSAPVEPKSPA